MGFWYICMYVCMQGAISTQGKGKSYRSQDETYDAVEVVWGKCWTDEFTSYILVFYFGLSLTAETFMQNMLIVLVNIAVRN